MAERDFCDVPFSSRKKGQGKTLSRQIKPHNSRGNEEVLTRDRHCEAFPERRRQHPLTGRAQPRHHGGNDWCSRWEGIWGAPRWEAVTKRERRGPGRNASENKAGGVGDQCLCSSLLNQGKELAGRWPRATHTQEVCEDTRAPKSSCARDFPKSMSPSCVWRAHSRQKSDGIQIRRTFSDLMPPFGQESPSWHPLLPPPPTPPSHSIQLVKLHCKTVRKSAWVWFFKPPGMKYQVGSENVQNFT